MGDPRAADRDAQRSPAGRGARAVIAGELQRIVALVRPGAALADSDVHGEHHWQAVCRIAARLGRATPGSDLELALLFGVLHDCRRYDESDDPDHGHRAADLTQELLDAGEILLARERAETLLFAVRHHAAGDVSADPTIATCWDADRLCLPRVGIAVDPAFLSTPTAVDLAQSATAIHRVPLLAWAEVDL